MKTSFAFPSTQDRVEPHHCLIAGFLLTGGFYLVDCVTAVVSGTHAEVPWLERGVYANWFGGFGVTILMAISTVIGTFRCALRPVPRERR
jgi:hypothetical protein